MHHICFVLALIPFRWGTHLNALLFFVRTSVPHTLTWNHTFDLCMCTLFLYCVNILCMYAMYVYYVWHVYNHVYVYCSSVHPSIHVCFVRILCMCAGYVSVYVYYICLPYIPCTCIPSKCVHPSIHPYVLCVYTIYVYYVCI